MTTTQRPQPVQKYELELGDSEVAITKFSDGIFLLNVDAGTLLLTEAQMREVVKLFNACREGQGWPLEPLPRDEHEDKPS
jgi:hypothetical protein